MSNTQNQPTIAEFIAELQEVAKAMKDKRNMERFLTRRKHMYKNLFLECYTEFRRIAGVCALVRGKYEELLSNTFRHLYEGNSSDPFGGINFGGITGGSYSEDCLNYSIRVREIEQTIIPFLKGLNQNATSI